jgi:hypothetical protein
MKFSCRSLASPLDCDCPWFRANESKGFSFPLPHSPHLYYISHKYIRQWEFPLDFDIFWIYNKDMNTTKTKNGRRGRPPKGSGMTKSEGILLKMEPREKTAFSKAAEIAGVPLSVWIRERLRRVARDELREAGKESPF